MLLLNGCSDDDSRAALGASKCFNHRKPRKTVHGSAVRAQGTADRICLRHLQHGAFKIVNRHCFDHRATFVAEDRGLISAKPDRKTTTAINAGDNFVRNDGKMIELLWSHVASQARAARFSKNSWRPSVWL